MNGGAPDGTASDKVTAGRRSLVALAAVVGLLVAWNLLRGPLVPHGLQPVANATMALVFLGVGLAAGLTRDELGLRTDRVPAGLAYGGVVVVVVLTGLLVAYFLPFTSGHLNDARVQVSWPRMLVQVLVVIPFGTVALEEIAFRGVLLGLLRRHLDVVRAVAVSAVLFGLWHINGVIRGSDAGALATFGAAFGTFIATTAAGVRIRVAAGAVRQPRRPGPGAPGDQLADVRGGVGALAMRWRAAGQACPKTPFRSVRAAVVLTLPRAQGLRK